MKSIAPIPSSSAFVTTRWTEVLTAGGESAEAKQALSDLCAAYYAPVIAFLRREGREEETARELAHEFFAHVLERQSLKGADPARGRFRSYLLGALKHFLANRRLGESRAKRGGGFAHEPLQSDTDAACDLGISTAAPPENDAVFDQQWALNLLERAFGALARENDQRGSRREYNVLKPWLTGAPAGKTQSAAAAELGISDGAVRLAIHRLRRRFREVVKIEIAQTVDHSGDVADELRYLISVLS